MFRLLPTGPATSPQQLRLEGERVWLRAPQARDWQDWAELRGRSRAFLTPWEPTWPQDALSRISYLRRLRRQMSEWRNDEAYALLLFLRRDDRLVGGLTLSNVRRGVAQTCTMGYWTGEPFAGRGLMTEAVTLAVEFAFGQLGLHRVEAACLPHNTASRRVLEKAGFEQEGYARSYLKIAGRWQDHVLFATVAGEDASRP